jgi:uncharacterized protein
VFVNPPPKAMTQRLQEAKTLAVLGLSDKPHRESYGVAEYLESAGYIVVPVNPRVRMWRGHQAFPSLVRAKAAAEDVGRTLDLVVVFRRPSAVWSVVKEMHRLGLPAAWFQLGVIDWDAAAWARDHGLWVVMDHCVAVEHRKLIGPPAAH